VTLPPALQRLADHEDIRELLAKYDRAFTARDVSAYLECLTEDCHIERRDSEPSCTGHEELANLVRDFPVSGFRVSTGLEIDLRGDEASMRHFLLYIDKGPPCEISMFGTWFDELVRTKQGWKFRERIFEPLVIRASELSAAFMDDARRMRGE
jgi:hypothetical protein